MPYLEILARNPRLGRDVSGADTRLSHDARAALARNLTDAVVLVFDVAPGTVTLFFPPIADEGYVHEGVLAADMSADDARRHRVLVKVHGYVRSIEHRRKLAAALTPLLAAYYDAPVGDVAVYFLDRTPDEVAHGGRLACDC